jgi:hypothetical protein
MKATVEKKRNASFVIKIAKLDSWTEGNDNQLVIL